MHVIQADHPEQTNHLTTLTTLTTLTNIFTRNCIVCNKLSFTIDKFRIRFDSWGLLLLVYKAIITYMPLSPSQGANLALLNAFFQEKCFVSVLNKQQLKAKISLISNKFYSEVYQELL